MDTNYNTKWTGIWDFIIASRYLTKEEIIKAKKGEDIGIPYDIQTKKNVITLAYRTSLNEMLANEKPYPIILTYEILGYGDTAPNENDVALETPENNTKKFITSTAVDKNKLNITSFWNVGEVEGNWKEYGVIAIKNNQEILFSRVAIERDLTATQALTVNGEITQSI